MNFNVLQFVLHFHHINLLYASLFFPDSSSQSNDDDLLQPSTGTNQSEEEALPGPQEGPLTDKLPRCHTVMNRKLLQGLLLL